VDRPFVTSLQASTLLGVSETAVIDDVQEGMDGRLPALNGGRSGDYWIVYAYECEGERLDMHRKRLASTSKASLP